MDKPDILEEIMDQLEPEQIPVEFILLAKVMTVDGQEVILSGAEFEHIMATDKKRIRDVRVILDVRKVKDTIDDLMIDILNAVHYH